MLRALLLLTVGVAAAFAGSSPANAYPLNDGRGTVIWPFEAHGSAASPGSSVYTY